MFFKKNTGCSCGGSCNETKNDLNVSKNMISSIKVLGSGCNSCKKLYENVLTAVKNINLEVETEYVTDMQKIMEYGVMSTPALIINDTIVSSGRLLTPDEIIRIIEK